MGSNGWPTVPPSAAVSDSAVGCDRFLYWVRLSQLPARHPIVTMLQRLGIEADKFASITGTMRGMKMTRKSF